ncbi:MAG: 50S ribosomal protein L24e [Nanoarchaeota archaeon]|nr:50S ribosomal protein L24e [Nanoarchaeota archaeon]MBU1322211.1 50S ribosomal protein L24e [Nanoarchaeota archaeon]MBU1597752.1 50S ribosomal protein L24e [Nanoarchaeota archaeon]MBU2442016.1 50S ribosomal protein L24e [Nanoarchaeota archaeon]
MPRCDFCRKQIEPGTGKIFVKKDGKAFDLCSSKCEKNLLKLKRKARTTKWTEEYADVKKGVKK